jgi:hypothetical protein
MTLPGFTAGNSLYRNNAAYRLPHDPNESESGSIKPAFSPPDFRFGHSLLTDPGPECVEVCKLVRERDPDTNEVDIYLDCHRKCFWP